MIGFFCSTPLPNYTTNPEAYFYLHGSVSSTGYYYYILKNNGIDNITLIQSVEQAKDCDALVFHYDDWNKVKRFGGKLIQVVTDRPYIEGIDAYVCCNEYMLKPKITTKLAKVYPFEDLSFDFVNDKWFHVHYPPTYGIKKCSPSFPPKNFKYVGRPYTLRKDIRDKSNIKKIQTSLGIKLVFDYKGDSNKGDEDVYFCIRDVSRISSMTGTSTAAGKNGNKTPNRLYQAWFMNTPSIFNISPEMHYLIQDEYDSSIANNFEEFYSACERLVKDEEFFLKSVQRCKEKCNKHNPYYNLSSVVKQWQTVFDFLKI